MSPTSAIAPPDPPRDKAPPPGLSLRAARPSVVRLRKPVVQGLVGAAALLVSGSLAWAFVIQPDLRDRARAQAAAETGRNGPGGEVRPSEAVTDQPASYDRLPPPRIGQETALPLGDPSPVGARRAQAEGPVWRPAAAAASSPRPGELAARSGLFFAEPPGAGPASGSGPERLGAFPASPVDGVYNPHRLTAPVSPYELKAGTVVPAALLTGLDTARSGPVVATVSQNVFDSISGRHLVLPQGTRLIGRHEGDSAFGDRRAFLVWDRLILPNGKSLVLEGEPGVDAEGAVGVRGYVDRRLLPLLAATLYAGAVTTLGQIARDDGTRGGGGWLGDAGDAAAITGAQVGGRLVDRELEVRPSIRLRPGAAVRVLITRDLVLEPYRS